MRCNYGIPWRIGGAFAEKSKKSMFLGQGFASDEIIVVVDRYDGSSMTRSAKWTIKRI